MHADNYIVMTTVEKEEDAVKLAKMAVELRLARGVNIMRNCRSIYSWQGEMCDETECVLLMKTGSVKLEELMEMIRNNHPYELPEIMAMPLTHGDDDFFRWVWDWVSAEK